MTSHSRHSVTAVTVTLPYLFRPAEIADALGCSEWWVKEQARRRRIPFTRVGGAYRFTADHLAEIIALFEERPALPARSTSETVPAQRSRRQRKPEPTTRLKARPPRRLRAAQQLGIAQ
jgi:excisionase family DNA binding protein